MRIQHNISALNAHRQLGANNEQVSKNLEKLSSGYRINRAGDDAAGLAISEKMRGQIRGLTQAKANAQDGISLIQTAEGGLNETHSILQRMRELSVQSANGTYQNDVDRENLNKEMDSLKGEIDRIASSTHFNKIQLLDGSMGGGGSGAKATGAGTGFGATDVTLSAESGIIVKLVSDKDAELAASSAAWGSGDKTLTVTVGSKSAAGLTQEKLNELIAGATGTKAGNVKVTLKGGSITTIAAAETITLTSATGTKEVNKGTNATFTATGTGNVGDLTVTAGTTEGGTVVPDGAQTLNIISGTSYTASQINDLMRKAGISFTAKFDGSKTGTQIAAGLTKTEGTGLAGGNAMKFQIGANGSADQQVELSVGDMSSVGIGVSAASVASQDEANAAIATIDDAINLVSGTRADLGALQNRLEHTVTNLGTTAENLTAAESRIRDVDMAKEMMEMTKNNILTQAAQSMLAQANTQPQGVLQLLR